MKRVLSLWMSVILLWSAVATVLPAWAEELPAPYAWLETADGTLQMSAGLTLAASGAYGRTDVLPLPNGDGYGVRMDYDWSGFVVEGDIFGNIPAGESAVLALEYYIDAQSTKNLQAFRYQLGDDEYVDLFTHEHNLATGETGVLLVALGAEQVSAYAAGSAALTLLACPGGAEVVYIRSMRLVAPQYTAVTTDGYEFIEFEERVLCDYYPDVTGTVVQNMAYRDLEQSESLPDVPWLYRYVQVHGETYTAEETVRRAVYVRVYAAAGYENEAVRVESFEREPGVWGEGATIQMTDGAGGVLLPSTCFGNRLNGCGSFRFTWVEAAKVARVEVYDVATYCTVSTDAARVAWVHAAMAAERVGTVVKGYRFATTETEGYTGDVYCAACETLIADGQAIPRVIDKNLPPPYVRMETVTGTTWVSEGVTILPGSVNGSDRAVPIGDTGKFGIRLASDWVGFHLTGEALTTVPDDAVLAIEYYLDTPTLGQMFRYRVGMAPQVDFYSATSHLVHQQTGLLLCTLSTDEIARLRAGEPLQILACPGGGGVTYIQSVQIIAAEYVMGATSGNDCVALADLPMCAYYPNWMGRYNNGMPYADVREGYDAMGKLQRYTYFATTKAQAASDAKTSPVVIRFTLREDSTLTEMTVDYQRARPQSLLDERVWASRTVAVNGTVVEVFLEDACFTNGLYEIGSFRVPNTEACPAADQLAAVEVVSVARREGLRAWIDRAEELTVEKTSASAAAFRAVVQAVTAVCADPWATADEIAAAEARIITAASALVPCAHRYADDKDTTCDDCGAVREVATALTGDVNGDEKVDSTDARLVLQYAVGKIDGNALDIAAADADGNGKVDSTDARLILQYAVRKIDGFSKK